MKLKIDFKSFEWWYWLVTLIAIIIGLSGWIEGFYSTILISIIQIVHFTVLDGLAALTTQVRIVYGIFTIAALFDPTQIIYWILLFGTIMVILFDKCMIATVLGSMPWNKNE